MAQEFKEGSCRKFWEEVWKPKQRGRFYDDFNYWSTLAWMDSAIRCFEADLGESKEKADG